jgi:hypothetical protein
VPRSKLVPSPQQREKVGKLSGLGLTHEQICAIVGVSSVTTLRRCFRKELAKGRLAANVRVQATAFRLASSGKNPVATIGWLKK